MPADVMEVLLHDIISAMIETLHPTPNLYLSDIYFVLQDDKITEDNSKDDNTPNLNEVMMSRPVSIQVREKDYRTQHSFGWDYKHTMTCKMLAILCTLDYDLQPGFFVIDVMSKCIVKLPSHNHNNLL